jgi:transcriptional regulator with XRE-family HTH domain
MTIKELREEAGLSPTQLASLAGISYPTLNKIETGQTTTHVYIRAVLSALSEKLGRVIKESDVSGLAII